MTKSELIKKLALTHEISIEDAGKVLNAFIETIKETLTTNGRVELRGFGSFKMKEYASYQGRNPKTGDYVTVAPKRMPFFRAGKKLKDFVNS